MKGIGKLHRNINIYKHIKNILRASFEKGGIPSISKF
jgi:hypothetical protein